MPLPMFEALQITTNRSIYEALRMVTSLQFHKENGEACPADFNDGRDGLVDTAQGIAGYLATH